VRAMIEEKCRGLQTLRHKLAPIKLQKSETFCRHRSLTGKVYFCTNPEEDQYD